MDSPKTSTPAIWQLPRNQLAVTDPSSGTSGLEFGVLMEVLWFGSLFYAAIKCLRFWEGEWKGRLWPHAALLTGAGLQGVTTGGVTAQEGKSTKLPFKSSAQVPS
ncbi:hypothetical protein GN956_G6277 [Arapaima gigas]